MPSNEWLLITVGAILVNNVVLTRILGICPFLGVSKRLETALGMSGAVIFVMTIASFVTAVLYKCLLTVELHINGQTVNLGFTKILLFIVVIASLVQIIEILLKKFTPALYSALGIYLPLITTNCAVLGAAELNAAANNGIGRGIIGSTVFGLCTGIGFGLALILFASLRERLELSMIPKPFQGVAIALITAGILAMAFMGFSGLVH
jgi:electron transport complex protein RnfA